MQLDVAKKRVAWRHRLEYENKGGEGLFHQQKHTSQQALRLGDDSSGVSVPLAALELYYTPEEVEPFLTFRLAGLSRYSLGWPRRAAAAFWESTQGRISKARMEALLTYALDKFRSHESKAKSLNYAGRSSLTWPKRSLTPVIRV